MEDHHHGRMLDGDLDWLSSMESKYGDPGGLIQLRREGLLHDLRCRVRADYVFWGAGQRNDATGAAAVLEFLDDADVDGDTEAERERKVDRWHRWARIGHEMNVTPATNRILSAITAERDHVTVNRATIMQVAAGVAKSRGRLRGVVDSLATAPLFIRRRFAGLDDFMFTALRISTRAGMSFGTGVGFHRSAGRPPFDDRDMRVAHAASRRFPWLHTVGVDANFDVTAFPTSHRVVLPFLLRAYTLPEIGRILDRSVKTIEKQITAICERMGLVATTRSALIEAFRPSWRPAISSGDDNEDLRAGIASLD